MQGGIAVVRPGCTASERRLAGRLRHLRQHDRAGYDALLAMLRRMTSAELSTSIRRTACDEIAHARRCDEGIASGGC